jgi:hypothetical protein
MRRTLGLTLLEVLASLALLSMIAATCVPLLERAMRVMAGTRATDGPLVTDLAEVANSALNEPGKYQIENWQIVESFTIPWQDHAAREPLAVVRMTSGETETDSQRINGDWVKFTFETTTIYRWIPVEESQPSAPKERK